MSCTYINYAPQNCDIHRLINKQGRSRYIMSAYRFYSIWHIFSIETGLIRQKDWQKKSYFYLNKLPLISLAVACEKRWPLWDHRKLSTPHPSPLISFAVACEKRWPLCDHRKLSHPPTHQSNPSIFRLVQGICRIFSKIYRNIKKRM